MSEPIKIRLINNRTPEEIEKSKREMEQRVWEANEAIRLSMPNRITKLRKEIDEKTIEANRLEALFKEYPNIKVREHRWGKITCYTKDINSLVTNFDIRHNCGCCEDSPLEVFPYLETPYGKVYSEPSCFTIGHKDYVETCDIPYKNWETSLKEAGIPDTLIEQIGLHFNKSEEEEDV